MTTWGLGDVGATLASRLTFFLHAQVVLTNAIDTNGNAVACTVPYMGTDEPYYWHGLPTSDRPFPYGFLVAPDSPV